MRRQVIALLVSLAACTGVACSETVEEDLADSEGAVATKNLTKRDFGLKEKEVVLTLDDGPGGRTVELAEWLAAQDPPVPAVFFQVGKNAKANPMAVARVAELSAQAGGTMIVANHSMTHTTPLPKQGVVGATNEIMNADEHLAASIQKSQTGLPGAISFFRPPYGAFTSLGATNIATINANGASKYTGPVFWDIGGELAGGFSADWACWGKNGVTVDTCLDGYIKETEARKGGIILVHDVHSKTVDMLMGTGTSRRSLVLELRKRGYTFVSLRNNEAAVREHMANLEKRGGNAAVSIEGKVDVEENDVDAEGKTRVVLGVTIHGSAKGTAVVDGNVEYTVNERALVMRLPPGNHFVKVQALDANGNVISEKQLSFVVPAPIEPGSVEATEEHEGAECVNFDLMKKGMRFLLLHDKQPCGPGMYRTPGLPDGECYANRGKLITTRDPKLVGPGEWSMDFDLSFRARPDDKSRLTMVMDADTGEITTGKRYAWTQGDRERSDLRMEFGEASCRTGIWRGRFVAPNGKWQSFVFRMLKNPLTNETLHGNDLD